MNDFKNPSSENSPNHSPVPIVAIGASAGGLEAVTQLLTTLSPTTGLAYVYIQHLDPNQESYLASILNQATKMPVVEAHDMIRIEPNHVYIIPPNKDMESIDGVLTLMPRAVQSSQHMPIDQFFISLAERQRDGAIAVLMSGMDSDGTLGLKAIKVAGGITFAQDNSAAYQSMPQTAIAEGVVDMVLSPAEIARELERLSQQADVFRQTALAETMDETQTADEDLRIIILFLQKNTGVDFSHYKVTTIRRRIIRRMLLYKLETLKEYAQYLRQYPTEANVLYNDLLINVTTFFRDTETMDYLKTSLLPQLVKSKSIREPIRVWIPACSTGQEAYSLAMLLVEVLGELAFSVPVQIFATDLSERAIVKARLGTYSRSEVVDISPQRLEQFFSKVDNQFRISRQIRDLCVFAHHNVFKDPPFSRIDLISCRNLLIYLDTVLQRKAITIFHYALNPSSYLVLGKSESVGTLGALFMQTDKNHKTFTRKNDVVSRATFEVNSYTGTGRPGIDRALNTGQSGENLYRTTNTTNPVKITPSPVYDLEKEVDSLLLSRYVPASVVVNQDLDILQFRGSTGLFLEPSPGKASLNLLKMARPSLVFELRNAVHKARKLNEPVRKTGLDIKLGEVVHQIALEAIPIKSNTEERLFLIIFQEIVPVVVSESQSTRTRNHRIKQLEDELAAVREDMHSILEEREASNEELQSANEEIVSSNEELQSINEELETSKEEIESTNEELLTINQELQVRNNQLSEAYGYAEAIFSTIREATVVLDRDFRVKSANRAFHDIFGFREDQIEGCLIYELGNREWDIPRLRQLLDEVINRNEYIQDFEVTHTFPGVGEKIMRLNARRVIRQHQQEAILLAIEDITEHKRAQRLVAEREAWFHDVIDKAPTLIWVAGSDGKYSFLNKAWLDYTDQPVDSNGSNNNWVQSIHPDDRQTYVNQYTKSLETRQPFDMEYRLLRRDSEYRWMMETARPTFTPDGVFTGYIGTCAEVHDQKTLNQELDRRVRQRTQELVEVNASLERSNQNLVQTAENLQAVLNSSPTFIGYFKKVSNDQDKTVDFQLASFNEKFFLFCKQELSVTGVSINQLASALWGDRTFGVLLNVVETGEPYYEERYGPNEDQWLAIAITKYDEGVVLTGLDITSLKKSEQQQEFWLQELARSNEIVQVLEPMRQHIRHRGEFLRTTTHDLRGSFSVIQGTASLLDLLDSDEERARIMTMLRRNLRQITQMLTQLLDYARLESGQEQIQVDSFDAAHLLKELSDSLQPMASERGLYMQTDGPTQLLVDGDQVKVQRIAQNLLLNALKYTRTGGVTIAWQLLPERDQWQFSVSDTGPGLPASLVRMLRDQPENDEENLESAISEPMQDSAGEGIGLFIVKRLCHLLEAQLNLDSSPDTGTQFRVVLARKLTVNG